MKIMSVELVFEDGSRRTYNRDTDTHLCILESDTNRDIAMSGSRERQVVMAKILESITTERLMELNKMTKEPEGT